MDMESGTCFFHPLWNTGLCFGQPQKFIARDCARPNNLPSPGKQGAFRETGTKEPFSRALSQTRAINIFIENHVLHIGYLQNTLTSYFSHYYLRDTLCTVYFPGHRLRYQWPDMFSAIFSGFSIPKADSRILSVN